MLSGLGKTRAKGKKYGKVKEFTGKSVQEFCCQEKGLKYINCVSFI